MAPLTIATITHSAIVGQIGICACPGRRLPPGIAGQHCRDLDADMETISDFGARAVLTLMEVGELDWAAVPLARLRAAVQARRMQSIYLPIIDQEAPDHHWERRWREQRDQLHRVLRTGGNLVIHCRGGRGRAGMVAARLLIEAGETPQMAMQLVRSARPGAIETVAQEQYLMALPTHEKAMGRFP
ncbi:MAG TPA: phosphatase [Alphaproteobacteria bacterium]|nr:phosphatase [Alphaproteobacteria bacterium]